MLEFEGAAPAPPPITGTFWVSRADEDQPLLLLKYGIPPLIPAMVRVTAPVDPLFVMIVPSPETEETPAAAELQPNVWLPVE